MTDRFVIFVPSLPLLTILFISLMQLVNRAQFLNITFVLVFLEAAPSAAVLLTVMFPVTNIYGSL